MMVVLSHTCGFDLSGSVCFYCSHRLTVIIKKENLLTVYFLTHSLVLITPKAGDNVEAIVLICYQNIS